MQLHRYNEIQLIQRYKRLICHSVMGIIITNWLSEDKIKKKRKINTKLSCKINIHVSKLMINIEKNECA